MTNKRYVFPRLKMTSSDEKTRDLNPLFDQVDEVAAQMKKNRDMALEREGRLDELNDRADDLRAKATKFNTTATEVRRKMWWENLRMKIIIGASVLVLLLVIIVIIILYCTDVLTGGKSS